MVKWIKNLFRSNNKQHVDSTNIRTITSGERDPEGFCDTYVNGEKTGVRMLVFTKEEIRKLLGKKDIPERFEDEDKTCVSCGVNLASCGSYYCGRCIDNGNY